MKIAAFVLFLSLLANLSFANLTTNNSTVHSNGCMVDTINRDGLIVSLQGEWTNIGQTSHATGFSSISLLADGKFVGKSLDGKKICGHWEVSKDGLSLVLHKTCEKTGKTDETTIAQMELVDGHLLTLTLPDEQGGKQTFVQ